MKKILLAFLFTLGIFSAFAQVKSNLKIIGTINNLTFTVAGKEFLFVDNLSDESGSNHQMAIGIPYSNKWEMSVDSFAKALNQLYSNYNKGLNSDIVVQKDWNDTTCKSCNYFSYDFSNKLYPFKIQLNQGNLKSSFLLSLNDFDDFVILVETASRILEERNRPKVVKKK